MRRILLTTAIILVSAMSMSGQSAIVKDFRPACDSLSRLIQERSSVYGELRLQAVMKRGGTLDFYFTESLSDYPWYKGDVQWFRKELRSLFPEKYRSYNLGEIYTKRISHDKLETPRLGSDGCPSYTRHSIDNPERRNIVTPLDGRDFSKGMSGRHIALWQSHGYYFDIDAERWQWQRPCLFQTVEDMFTQSFVLPFLVPMLENAGAYVLLPRERDIQKNEVIADNDGCDPAYGKSTYEEKGKWKDIPSGFAALKPVYEGIENPFTCGSARQAECVQNGKPGSSVTWTPEIPERGEYAVYVSYKTLKESTACARYTVRHMGGSSDFVVDQRMGGGTWIYLGTFEFAEGSEGCVTLTNETPEGFRHVKGSLVSADAVRFGGGTGNIARSRKGADYPAEVSGMPRSAEGARYWLQWAGASPDIFSQNEMKNDYRDDFMSRGDWVEWISRGSEINSSKKGMGIPVDLSFGFHSDAGVTPNDSIVGTLAIYTLRSEGSQTLPTGDSRMTSREYADLVQSQIVNDLRAEFDPLWSRRQIWDRGYRESRTPSAPAMLLELLSHQNFADMKYGLDPTFRFTVSRAVYKGMLKYLSNRYEVPYTVQPLPVNSMGVRFGKDGNVVISWKETEDPLEPTASADGFILYTRVDDGGFDTGTEIKGIRRNGDVLSCEVKTEPGRIYSYRIASFNDGGRSFPSETVSIGRPSGYDGTGNILIVNNFDRISGPAFIDTPEYAGFDNRKDGGVPYVRDIAYIGDMYEFRRQAEFMTNDRPGFGASYSDYAGNTVAGNTFDFPYIHGKLFLEAGLPFYSCSNEAFCSDSTFRSGAWSVDLICGKQVTTSVGSGMKQSFEVFPAEMQEALSVFAAEGGNILVSGAYIGTDVWDSVYPVCKDSTSIEETRKFVRNVLGYRLSSGSGSRKGKVRFIRNTLIDTDLTTTLEIVNEMNQDTYCVESPDGISPATAKGKSIMRYTDTGISAGICHQGDGYKTVCLGFPIEALRDEEDRGQIIKTTIEFFRK